MFFLGPLGSVLYLFFLFGDSFYRGNIEDTELTVAPVRLDLTITAPPPHHTHPCVTGLTSRVKKDKTFKRCILGGGFEVIGRCP